MPQPLSKSEALQLLAQEGDTGECLICRILQAHPYKIAEDEHAVALLTGYPRFWGHVMICLRRHAEKHSELSEEEHASLYRFAHRAAAALEQQLSPARCYVASLGSTENRINTCPHLHVHVIPVPDPGLRPSEVFTWENGLFRGSEEEWESLYFSIKTGLTGL